MKSSTTVRDILREEGSGLANWEDHVVAKLYQLIEKEVIGDDEELEPLDVWLEKTKNYGGDEEEYWKLRSIINSYNNHRQEQRQALSRLFSKGGDNV